MKSHAQLPVVDAVSPDVLRIYFGTRDERRRTVTTYCEVARTNPLQVLYVHDRPVLGLGERGCFDDSGAMPAWLVSHRGVKYLFYTGWTVATTVPYRKAIGVAMSEDGGRTFARVSNGPILDRTYEEPYCAATPCVLLESGVWRMWYLSCVGWKVHGPRLDPSYHIKYADSLDGVHWNRPGTVALDCQRAGGEALGRPCVNRAADGRYTMWYSYRGEAEFRTNRRTSYRIGYAESDDGLTWSRWDECAGIDLSAEGWDSEMIAYPFLLSTEDGIRYLFYNGNGFGKSGFGYAVQSSERDEEPVRARLAAPFV
jgi:hypothetical protein